jgi:hypothetical protein
MSVTFSVYKDEEFVTPEGWEPTYEVDYDYGFPPDFKVQTNQNPLEMNVANGNYCRIMALVGLSYEEYCGTWGDGSLQHVKEQLEFTLNGLKVMPELDGGIPSEKFKAEGGCMIIDCGLREGYFTEALTRLLAIVDKAIEVDGTVTFG